MHVILSNKFTTVAVVGLLADIKEEDMEEDEPLPPSPEPLPPSPEPLPPSPEPLPPSPEPLPPLPEPNLSDGMVPEDVRSALKRDRIESNTSQPVANPANRRSARIPSKNAIAIDEIPTEQDSMTLMEGRPEVWGLRSNKNNDGDALLDGYDSYEEL